MRAQWRTEAVLALVYLLAVPFVVFLALFVQIAVLEVTSSPTLSYELLFLLHTLPALVAGALLFILVGLIAHENVADASLARWPVRAAPLLLAAAAPTAIGVWLIVVQGHWKLNGLIVLPSLVLWGGIAGEWIAHAWFARGRSGNLLLRRSFFSVATVVGALVLSAWILRSPQGELEFARKECRTQYSRSRTAEDSAFTDQWKPTIARELGTRTCAELLAAEQSAAVDGGAYMQR